MPRNVKSMRQDTKALRVAGWGMLAFGVATSPVLLGGGVIASIGFILLLASLLTEPGRNEVG